VDVDPALDIIVVELDGTHVAEHLVRVAAIGVDGDGVKHPLRLIEGATEHAAVAQALIDGLIERALDTAVLRLFIIDGAKVLSRATRGSFGKHTLCKNIKQSHPCSASKKLPNVIPGSDRFAIFHTSGTSPTLLKAT
jgi:hypothetical protein